MNKDRKKKLEEMISELEIIKQGFEDLLEDVLENVQDTNL